MKQTILSFLLLCSTYLFAQDTAVTSCGQKKATENLFLRNPQIKLLHDQMEARLLEYNRTKKLRGDSEDQRTNAVVNLPVVVHIIHNNGPENISNAQVQTAIQHLNEAFANTGYYDPADGVNTEIQFCLAKRDPAGNATNGINRVVSPLTVMNGWQDYSVDLAVKNLSRWDPRCYVNIWVVGDITGGVAGYAYLPSAHGSNVDGIVLEARYFGTSYSNDIVVIHEMGHYLGLYHTFEGGCSNNDCAVNGDRICDTPPDQSTVGISCNSSVNSCTTDTQSGFSTDQNDLHQDYMDYGNWNCMKVYTQGQKDRMNWVIQNIRRSLLNCRSCEDPCPAPAVANFTSSANNVSIGTLVNFTNTSSNATGYRWYINDVLQSTSTNYSYTFNAGGTFVIKLVATSGSILCDSAFKYDTVRVTCPVTVGFSPLSTSANTNVTVNFINSSTGATSYQWYVNGTLQGTGVNFSYAFTAAGNYSIKLKAINNNCADSIGGTVVVTDTCLRQTFQKTYGGPGDDVAYDVRSTTDGGYIMAGKTNSFGAGGYDAYVVKMDNQGVVQWSRVYGGAGDDYVYRLLQTADGGYVMAGQTKSYNNPAGDAWVIKTDGAGTIQWTKRYGENSQFGEQAITICTTSDGGYAFVGSQNGAPGTSNVLVVKLDANGNVQWSRVYDSGNTDGGGSTIVEDNGVLMVTAFTRTSLSYHDGIVMKILMADGNLQWMRRYEVDGRNNFGGELFKVGNGYRFHIPSIQDFSNLNTGRNITLTLDTDGNATAVRQLVPPDFGNGPILIMPDGSEIAVYNEQNTTSEFNIMKVSSNNSIQWAKKYLRPGPQVNYVIRPSQDGGFITIGASNPSSNNDIYVAKIDIQGNSPGCDTARINVAVQTPPFSSGLFNWSIQRPANFTNPMNINVVTGSATTLESALCTGSTCVDTIPVDTCNGYTYLKLLGRGAFNAGYSVKRTPDGGSIVVGRTGATVATTDALIIKLDAKGNVVWSKTYGTPGEDAFIHFIQTSDGNYVAAGMGRFNPSHRTDAWVMKFDPNGNVIWSKSFGAGTTFGERIYNIAETNDGGFVMAANYNWDASTLIPLYLRLDANGNLVWSKLMGGGGGENASVAPDGDIFYGGGVITRSSATLNDGFLVKMRLSDGSLLWTRSLESQGRSNRFDHMQLKNGQLIFSMFNVDSWTTGNFTPLIVKADTTGNIISSRSYEIQGLNRNAVHTVVHPTPDGGAITSLSELGSNTSPRLAKVAANGQVNWSHGYGNYQSHVLWRMYEDSAGYVTVGQAIKQGGGNQNILLFRSTLTGSYSGTGSAQNCPVTATAAVDNNIPVQSIPQNPSYWTITSGNIQSIPAVPTVADVTLTVETPCIDTADCDPPPPDDTCNKKSFVKRYNTNSAGIGMLRSVRGPDGSLYSVGMAVDSSAGSVGGVLWNRMLMKTDSLGEVIWTKKIVSPDTSTGVNSFVIYTRDHHIVAAGWHETNTVGFGLTRYDTSGSLIWQRLLHNGGMYVNSSISNVLEDSNEDLYVFFNDPMSDGAILSKFSKAGNILWSKKYATPVVFGIDAISITLLDDHLYVTGFTAIEKYVMKVNKSDGSLIWANNYTSGQFLQLSQIWAHNNQLTLGGWTSTNNMAHNMVMRINTDGTVAGARKYIHPAVTNGSIYRMLSDGSIVIYTPYYIGNPTTVLYPAVIKIKNDLSVDWAKNYPFIFYGSARDVIGLRDQSLVLIGGGRSGLSDPGGYNYIMRLNARGSLTDCPSVSMNVLDSSITVSVTPINNITVANYTFLSDNYVYSQANHLVYASDEKCSQRTSCDSLNITGMDTVCNIPDTVVYHLSRNGDCTSPATWSLNNNNAQILSFTDTSVTVRFVRLGTVVLSATMFADCGQITDTLAIAILQSRDSLNLGPDRELCAISVITLNAGSGFASYRWQNGSTDSTLTVDQPGTYFVEAADYCGNVLRDTVVISLAAPIPFDLGPDVALCNNDTLTIIAPGGFTRYTWADNYNINNRYTQSVRVWPSADTTYSVIAETTLGCLVYDSIRVTVKFAPPIDIGADTSFCQNDSAIISATPGFTDYTWNTGATTQQITVKNRGIYYIRATAPNGCISKDTMEVLNVFGLPTVNIGKDTIICENNSYTFDAGTHATYLWHDGSTGNTFTATQVGQVWVRVVNSNGCVASDTAHILRIAAPPTNFLDTAAEFCPYEKATLFAKGIFVRYRWSTGSISPTIETNIPGTYWLEVTNTDGCTNREYINVKTKICRISINFPNAFTPNNDRTNDTYKPIVRGTLVEYKLTIYNRWGQRVFESTDYTRAWDGTVGGKPQDSGGFVWICRYKFAGEEMKTARGNLLLIR